MIKLTIQTTDCGMTTFVSGWNQARTHVFEIENKRLETSILEDWSKAESWCAETVSVLPEEKPFANGTVAVEG